MPSSPDMEAPLPKRGLAIVAYVAAVIGAVAIWIAWSPRGVALAATLAVPALAFLWMMRQCMRHRRAAGPATTAQRAYVRRFIPLMLAYAVVLCAATWLVKTLAPTGPLAFLLALLPALPLIGVVWSMGRLVVEERDEYQRSLIVRQILVATGFMLAVTSVWGFLESFGQAPHIPMYWAFIIWCAGLGLGAFVNELRR